MSVIAMDHEQLAENILRENEILYDRLSAALCCGREESLTAMCEVLRFLWLIANRAESSLTPSKRVDLAWHEFILCTRAYRDTCTKHFGRFIDHHPGGPADLNRRQYQRTVELYQIEFGTLEPRFWAGSLPSAECGLCEAS